MYSVPVVSTWRKVHSLHGSQVIGMVASFQGHGGYDGPVVTYSTTVAVFVHQPGRDHGSADGLSRVPSSPCRQCTRPDCPPVVEVTEYVDQPFDSESTGSSEDTDLVPIDSGEDWVALLDDD